MIGEPPDLRRSRLRALAHRAEYDAARKAAKRASTRRRAAEQAVARINAIRDESGLEPVDVAPPAHFNPPHRFFSRWGEA